MSLKKADILIVDDICAVREMMAAYFEDMGHRPVLAKNAEEGLALLEERMCDLVIADYMMEGSGGLDLLKWIRSRWRVPFLLMTGYPSENLAVEALNSGADGFLYKPFTLEDLKLSIHPLLTESRERNRSRKVEGGLRREIYKLRRNFSMISQFDDFCRSIGDSYSLESLFKNFCFHLKETFDVDFSGYFHIDSGKAHFYTPDKSGNSKKIISRLIGSFKRDMLNRKVDYMGLKVVLVPGLSEVFGERDIVQTLLLPLNSTGGKVSTLAMGWSRRYLMDEESTMLLRWFGEKFSDRIEIIMQSIEAGMITGEIENRENISASRMLG